MISKMGKQFSWARRIFRAGAGLLLLGLTAQTELQEPFGLPTFVVADGLLPATWEDLREEIEADKAVIARCRARLEDCSSPAALRFIAIVDEGRPHQGLVRIGHINRAVNLSIRGIKNAAPSDWTSPLVALADGAGDCKQHAILKYAALRDVGLSPDSIRIVIVEDKVLHQKHALVAVRDEGRWIFLNNHSSILAEGDQMTKRYTPLNVLDHVGVKAFMSPSFQVQKGSGSDGG
jgi:predicted transglutaminase-like cysteine proteinase